MLSAGVTPAFSARVTEAIEWVRVGWWGRSGAILGGGAAVMICALGGIEEGGSSLAASFPISFCDPESPRRGRDTSWAGGGRGF